MPTVSDPIDNITCDLSMGFMKPTAFLTPDVYLHLALSLLPIPSEILAHTSLNIPR